MTLAVTLASILSSSGWILVLVPATLVAWIPLVLQWCLGSLPTLVPSYIGVWIPFGCLHWCIATLVLGVLGLPAQLHFCLATLVPGFLGCLLHWCLATLLLHWWGSLRSYIAATLVTGFPWVPTLPLDWCLDCSGSCIVATLVPGFPWFLHCCYYCLVLGILS